MDFQQNKLSFCLKLALSTALFVSPTIHAESLVYLDGKLLTSSSGNGFLSTTFLGEENGQISLPYFQTKFRLEGRNILLELQGKHTTLGDVANIVESQAEDGFVLNNGDITTRGDFSDAIAIYKDYTKAYITNQYLPIPVSRYAAITNNGNIETYGSSSSAIHAEVTNSSVINNGNIKVFGDYSTAVWATNDISNNGYIFSKSGAGVQVSNLSSVITPSNRVIKINNTGTVESYSIALNVVAYDLSITNRGNLISETNSAISLWGRNKYINNYGNIQAGTKALLLGDSGDGGTTVINNYGTISVSKAGDYAIFDFGENTRLNLYAGSQINGRINLGGNTDNDTVTIYGDGSFFNGVSTSLLFENVENIQLVGATNSFINDTQDGVVTIDPTGESSRSTSLATSNASIHRLIKQRAYSSYQYKPVQVAALSLSKEMIFQERKPVAWTQVFGGSLNRDNDGAALAYDSQHAGVIFGYEKDISKKRLGLFAGYVNANTDSETDSFSHDSDSYYLGAYGHVFFDSFTLTASFIGGYGEHDNQRSVANNVTGGIETASSDVDSYFISPSLSLSSSFDMADRLMLRPLISATYDVAWFDSYQEKGLSSANLRIKDRKVDVLSLRAQLATAYQLTEQSEFEFRVGVNSRHNSSSSIKGSVGSSTFSFNEAGEDNIVNKYAGINVSVATQQNLKLAFDVELGGDDKERYANASLNLDYLF